MDIFQLPNSTRVEKIIPKNIFDPYCDTKDKRLFTEYVQKILWLHKLSEDTIHLEGCTIQEIQIIQIELKKKEKIDKILEIMDKYMPYTIIFLVLYNTEFYISTTVKQLNSKQDSISILDWTFHTDWEEFREKSYPLHLSTTLDAVYHRFCHEIIGYDLIQKTSLEELVSSAREVHMLEKEINSLKKKLNSTKQFNQKVEINRILNEKIDKLERIKR